jgi:PREDICTED: similar to syne-1B
MAEQNKEKELLELADTQDKNKKKNKKKKKRKFKITYFTIGGLLLGTVGSVLGAGTPLLVALFTAGLIGALGGAMTGFVVKTILKVGSGLKKVVTKLFRKEETEDVTEEKETEKEEEEIKENLLDKAKNLWQSIKDKVEEVNFARQEKKEAKLEERKRKAEDQEEEYDEDQEDDYEEEQDLEDKPSLKERFLSKFRRKKKKEVSDEVKNILKLDDEVELEEGNKPIDTSKVDENKDLASTPVETQEINPLFTYRIKRSELRKPKYVIFDEIYEPHSLETMSNGHLSVNMDQFIETAKKRLDVLNEQLIRTQNEIAELENQIANTYTEPERKLVR